MRAFLAGLPLKKGVGAFCPSHTLSPKRFDGLVYGDGKMLPPPPAATFYSLFCTALICVNRLDTTRENARATFA
jgi:hypothetical protein